MTIFMITNLSLSCYNALNVANLITTFAWASHLLPLLINSRNFKSTGDAPSAKFATFVAKMETKNNFWYVIGVMEDFIPTA